MKLFGGIALAAILAVSGVISTGVVAQSLTPDQIRGMIDQKVSTLNPYQELLNDADPSRSLAAMQIMLESGDRDLARMALEFGLLSPNAAVKRTAFESFLTTGPVFSIRFDGKGVKSSDYASRIRNNWDGNLSPENIGYWRISVGSFLPEKKCFADTYYTSDCFVTVNSDGIFLTPKYMSARGVIGDDGVLAGVASITSVGEPVPFRIQLLD